MMNMPSEIVLSISCIGIAVFIIAYSLLHEAAKVPEDNRVYQDRLPAGFQLIWPLIRLCVHVLGPMLSLKIRKQMHARLCYGGADYILSPEQYFFSSFCAGISMGLSSFLLFELLDISSPLLLTIIFALGFNLPNSWLQKRIKQRETSILRALPTYLDILTLAMESGSNFIGALDSAVEKSKHDALKQEFSRVLRDIQAGKTKHFALNGLRTRVKLNAINSFVSSIIQAEKTGAPVGKILRAQADQRRFERFALAEKLGQEAPIKLLGPLVMFIFPTTFIILIFLITVKIYDTGIVSGAAFQILMSNPLDMLNLFKP